MTIELQPELESLIRRGVESGAYDSADHFLAEAVHMLHQRDEWLLSNREVIGNLIEEGWASSEHGEVSTEAEVRERMQQKKTVWMERHPLA